jgi:2-polyprenyl-3-methyl-5-hydroxy-6-metoxy-1,4-benzoquinol methylase
MELNKLVNPITGDKLILEDIDYFSGIPNLYFDDNNPITSTQSKFYNDIKFPNYDNIDDFGTLLEKSSKSIFAKKLDNEIPYHSRVLEAGCGTGQLSISLSRYGRKIHSIDLSEGSLMEAKSFIDKNEIKNVQLAKMNIFNLCFPKNYFDVIISNGVLHHTHNPELAFSKLVECLKPGGIIIIGLYHKYGRVVQNIRQKLIQTFGERIKFIDKRFSENLSERKKYAWFRDQYNNPHETKHSYHEVVKWFESEDIKFINSLPFNFDINDKLFDQRPILSKSEILLKEYALMFNLRQIYEGGFFIMIGKKE